MPELPEVETARKQAAAVLVGREIVSVHAMRDELVFAGMGPAAIKKALRGRSVIEVGRKGKQMWWEFAEGSPHLMVHFRMSGDYHIYQNASERPRFLKLEVTTDAGQRLAITNKRRFGRILLTDDPLAEPSVMKLGPDPLHDLPDLKWFREKLASRQAPLKSVLLDQSFLAGIGNWIADEVCYQSRLDPRKKASALTGPQVRRVREKIASIITLAVEVEADDSRFPGDWLFPHRWGKNANARTHDDRMIQFCQVGGRTTAYVPGLQK